jgi:hypothetical protein
MTRFERRQTARERRRRDRLRTLVVSVALALNLVALLAAALSGCGIDTCHTLDIGCTPPPPPPPPPPGATQAHWAPPNADGGAPAAAQAGRRD